MATSPRGRQALVCARCQSEHPLGPLFGCPRCLATGRQQPLEVAYLDREASRGALRAELGTEGARRLSLDDPGIWRWRSVLPRVGVELTLGEGRTPLRRSRRAGAALGMPSLLLKYEGSGPSGSYKDRFQAVSISAALGFGFRRVFCSSTGNHGLAAATYARVAGLECLVLLHEEAASTFEDAIQCLGATVGRIPAAERAPLMVQLTADGWFPATAQGWPPAANPFGVEGYKTIAYEVFEQLGRAPAAMVVPVGAGDGYYGVTKGFLELAHLGFAAAPTSVFAAQPVGADPMVQALAGDKDEVEPLTEVAKSVALSIREADSGSHALRLARESAGGAVAVTDTETVRAAELLADEGLIVDIASAASVAGAARLAADGAIDRQAPVVALLTASGARWPRPVTYTLSGRSVRGTAADVRGILC